MLKLTSQNPKTLIYTHQQKKHRKNCLIETKSLKVSQAQMKIKLYLLEKMFCFRCFASSMCFEFARYLVWDAYGMEDR